MRFQWALFSILILFGFYSTTTHGLFDGFPFQDYVDSLVDAASFKINGMLSVNDSTVNRMWSYFKSKYGRVYSSVGEEKQRFTIFRDHLKYVLESNLRKLQTFQLELNEFADWTIEEFNTFKKGLNTAADLRRRTFEDDILDEDSIRRSLTKLHERHHHSRRLKRSIFNQQDQQKSSGQRRFSNWIWNFITDGSSNNNNGGGGGGSQPGGSFDWRSKNVVGSIKNQLKCGSCYAIATAAVLESIYAIKTNSKSVTEFSPQQITDCSSNGNNGCSGGNFLPSIRYILGTGSKIATHASYPYAGQRQACKTSGINQINLGNIQYGAIPEGDEKTMAQSLVNYGPLYIGLDTDSKLFMFYKSGVLSINNCPTRRQDMDHAMVVVGYGYDSAVRMSYWIIKNSWGAGWGESGYVRLAKDKGNMCGITSMAYYAKLS